MAKKILIVDDSDTIRGLVRAMLDGSGLEVLEAGTGEDGLKVLKEHPDLVLILCDVKMPQMGGLEMLRLVKQDPRFAKLPVIMLTTESNPAMMLQAKEAGAKGWVVKPFRIELLLSAIHKLARGSDRHVA